MGNRDEAIVRLSFTKLVHEADSSYNAHLDGDKNEQHRGENE